MQPIHQKPQCPRCGSYDTIKTTHKSSYILRQIPKHIAYFVLGLITDGSIYTGEKNDKSKEVQCKNCGNIWIDQWTLPSDKEFSCPRCGRSVAPKSLACPYCKKQLTELVVKDKEDIW